MRIYLQVVVNRPLTSRLELMENNLLRGSIVILRAKLLVEELLLRWISRGGSYLYRLL